MGDAGLFGRSCLSHRIREGLLTTENIPFYFESGEVKRIHSYLVGDAAFLLGVHMMKSFDPAPAAGTPEKEYNKRILLARRVIERAFGRLKSRWIFCKRKTCWNTPDFCRGN